MTANTTPGSVASSHHSGIATKAPVSMDVPGGPHTKTAPAYIHCYGHGGSDFANRSRLVGTEAVHDKPRRPHFHSFGPHRGHVAAQGQRFIRLPGKRTNLTLIV